AIGFRDSISPLLLPHMKRALVLGTGGASKAVIYVLRQLGLEVLNVSRRSKGEIVSYNQLTPEIISTHHVIVNTTPLGMWPNIDDAPEIPYHLLTPDHLCYDLVYNPEETSFMKRAAQYGATVKNGLEMLHGQALAAWKIWNKPD
ncbi:MAG: shikimate dehydrogenase, partial [Muribaculaceae bacterium]|nr:shikimate dehydrogenase [Muribaculaceae bacterium]